MYAGKNQITFMVSLATVANAPLPISSVHSDSKTYQ